MSDTTVNRATLEENVESQQDAVHLEHSVGAQLATRRKAHAWTIEQVASQLNLAPRQIQALEEDNYAALPGMASVRGFIRAYAKILKTDAQPLMAMMTYETTVVSEPPPMRRPLPTSFSGNSRLPSLGGGHKPSKAIFVIVPAVILAIVTFATHQMGWIPPVEAFFKKTLVSASVTTPVENALSVPVSEQKEERNTATATYTPVSMAAIPDTDRTLSTETTGNPPISVVNSDLQATGKNALILEIREDSWVEIRQSDNDDVDHENLPNKLLSSHLAKAGAYETFEITSPVLVTIGNAEAVKATLRGVPLDLKINTKNNIARLNLK